MKLILPICAIICTVLSTLTAIVFCMAGGANSSPVEIRNLKIGMVCVSLVGIGGVVAGILLLRAGQHSWAAGAAFLPTVLFIGTFIVMIIVGKS